MKFKLGFEPKMYVGSAGAAPSSALDGITDVSLDLNTGAVDATTRASGKFKTYIAGQIDASINFKMPADGDSATNAQTAMIRNAWLGRTPLAFKVELGDGAFFQADMIVDQMKNDQPIGDLVAYDVTLKPTITNASFVPTVDVGSGASS